jgi:hypothetical protein
MISLLSFSLNKMRICRVLCKGDKWTIIWKNSMVSHDAHSSSSIFKVENIFACLWVCWATEGVGHTPNGDG